MAIDGENVFPTLYKRNLINPLNFIKTVTPYGLTAISQMDDLTKDFPATSHKIQITGKAAVSQDPKMDDSLKIPADLLVKDEPAIYDNHVSLNVFLTVDDKFQFKMVVTPCYTMDTFIGNTPAGSKFAQDSLYIAHIKLGHTLNQQRYNNALIQNSDSTWRLCNFMFAPQLEWTVYMPPSRGAEGQTEPVRLAYYNVQTFGGKECNLYKYLTTTEKMNQTVASLHDNKSPEFLNDFNVGLSPVFGFLAN